MCRKEKRSQIAETLHGMKIIEYEWKHESSLSGTQNKAAPSFIQFCELKFNDQPKRNDK